MGGSAARANTHWLHYRSGNFILIAVSLLALLGFILRWTARHNPAYLRGIFFVALWNAGRGRK